MSEKHAKPAADGGIHDIEALLAEIDALTRAGRPPTRFHARDLLVGLGEALLAGADDRAARWIAALAPRIEAARPAFERAVAEELTLACTEHVRACDARYLKLPRYDFHYTVAARHRLEARLRAVEELGLPIDERLLEQVARADETLAPYLGGDGRT